MNREKLHTWFGLRKVDVLVYLAMAAILGMYLVDNPPAEVALAVLAVILLLVACPLGMRASSRVSHLTNITKKLAYPCSVLGAGCFIANHYVGHYQIPQNGMYPGLPAGSHFLMIRRPYQEPDQVARGDIIQFNRMENGKQYLFIWRVVGLPGDAIQTSSDAVIVNGVELNHRQIRTDGDLVIYEETNGDATYEIALPAHAGSTVPPNVRRLDFLARCRRICQRRQPRQAASPLRWAPRRTGRLRDAAALRLADRRRPADPRGTMPPLPQPSPDPLVLPHPRADPAGHQPPRPRNPLHRHLHRPLRLHRPAPASGQGAAQPAALAPGGSRAA